MAKARKREQVSPAKVEAPAHAPSLHRSSDVWIGLALVAAVFALYARVWTFDFVNFDDPDYVRTSGRGLLWALTSGEAANWFPVTRLSHLLDGLLFGMRSAGPHLVNVLWHTAATLFLFRVLRRATRRPWPSAFVACVFALHPLHVESVAWVAERKDVLSAFFCFLTLWAYVRYTERRNARWYACTLLAFALGLMAKPMLVTLPLLLLLLDRWPLGRHAYREKLPFFALSAVSAIVTFTVQHSAGAVQEIATFPLGFRLQNALVTYVIYAVKMFWAVRLAVFYPYPAEFAAWQVLVALALLIAISAAAWKALRTHPYFAVGWAWYLVTLVPVIGLVQVGAQARADRYMYIPMTGLAIALAWAVAELVSRRPQWKPGIAALAIAGCLAMLPVAWAQVGYWQNSETLFRHALAVTDGNYLAHHNLGVALAGQGRWQEAIAEYEAALKIRPDYATARTDLGNALARAPGHAAEAIPQYRAALAAMPGSAIPHNDLGNALATAGRVPEAIAEYEIALRLKPDYAEAHNNLGKALAGLGGRNAEAMAHYHQALQLQPELAEAHANLGDALMAAGRVPDALAEYQAALRIRPDLAEAHHSLGRALSDLPGRMPDAAAEYQAALRGRPDFPEAHYDLGLALSTMQKPAEALAQFEEALRLRPDYAEAHNNLGVILTQDPRRSAEALAHFEAAARLAPSYMDAQYNLGVALAQVPGRVPEAIAHLEAAQRLHPDAELAATIQRLKSGR
jgi:tetratricopeptide (TPR) repeat protein